MMACYRHLDQNFRLSCHHMQILNRHIEMMHIRYDRALYANQRTFRYSHRFKLATLEAMRNMYYEYACRRAAQLEHMQDDFIQQGLIWESSEAGQSDTDT